MSGLILGQDTDASTRPQREVRVNSLGEIYQAQFANIEQDADAAADDSDKTFTVPADEQWRLISIYVLLTSTSDVGDRQLDIEITDGTNLLMKAVAGAVQPESNAYTYVFALGNPQETSFTNDVMYRLLPSGLILPAGYEIRVYDSAAIQAAADDMTVRILHETASL